MYFYRATNNFMGQFAIGSFRKLCGLCASVLIHHRSFNGSRSVRNTRSHGAVPVYAGR